MQNIKYKYHPQRMVGRPTSIPFSGDVPLSLRETPIPICSILTEAKLNTNIQHIRKTTNAVLTKLTNYINNSETFDFNRKPKEILKSVHKLFSLRGYQTKYALYQRTDGSIIDFRLGLHDANGKNFDSKNINISVYISYTYRSYRGLSTTPYEEYEIKPQTFKENPKMVVDALVNGVLSAINSKPFELDPNVATSIDTTKTDTIEDIINRYKDRTYKFSDGTKTYGLKIDKVESCTIKQINMNLKDGTNTIYSLLIESDNNKTYLLSANNKILIKPTKDQKEEWAEIIHCLFKYAYNSANNKNKQDTNMKTENRNRNVVRLTESQLKQIVAESVKNVLNEEYYGNVYSTDSDALKNLYAIRDNAQHALDALDKCTYNKHGRLDKNAFFDAMAWCESLYHDCMPFCKYIEHYMKVKASGYYDDYKWATPDED